MRAHATSLAESLPEIAQHALQQLRRGEGFGHSRRELNALRDEIRAANRRTLLMLVALGFAAIPSTAWLSDPGPPLLGAPGLGVAATLAAPVFARRALRPSCRRARVAPARKELLAEA